jgi:hypothetical protein
MTGGDATVAVVVVVLAALAALVTAGRAWGAEEERRGNGTVAGRREVTYDGRALILDGARRMLFSGDVHYPRSTPEVRSSRLLLASCIMLNAHAVRACEESMPFLASRTA